MDCPAEMAPEIFDEVIWRFRAFVGDRIEPEKIERIGMSPDGREVFKVSGLRRVLGLKRLAHPISLFDEAETIGQAEVDWALVWLPEK